MLRPVQWGCFRWNYSTDHYSFFHLPSWNSLWRKLYARLLPFWSGYRHILRCCSAADRTHSLRYDCSLDFYFDSVAFGLLFGLELPTHPNFQRQSHLTVTIKKPVMDLNLNSRKWSTSKLVEASACGIHKLQVFSAVTFNLSLVSVATIVALVLLISSMKLWRLTFVRGLTVL